MDMSFGSSDRRQPLSSSGPVSPSLNNTLNTSYIDVPQEDTSLLAKTTRCIAGCTGKIFSPHQVLVMIRILQTLTFVCLIFNAISDLMYIFFVSLVVSDEVNEKVGGARDVIIRWYGLGMAIMSLMIEFELPWFLKHFPALKGYVPRSFLLFFVATITSPNPLHYDYAFSKKQDKQDGDYYADDDLAYQQVTTEIPGSTVRFQMVTSFLLSLCALTYFLLGIMCVDRFTSKAFVSRTNVVKATEIPQPTQSSQQAVPSHVDPSLYATP